MRGTPRQSWGPGMSASDDDARVYLGDSVYGRFDGYVITLTTENGLEATNTIVIEPEVYQALLSWVERLKARAKAASGG